MSGWQRFVKALPLAVGLLLVAGVWVAGAVWSFSEQRDFAANRGFDIPALLPLTIDGLALSLAVVAWSAALDGRAAVQARLGTFVAIVASAGSNATWASSRTSGDVIAVTLAAGVPLAAAVAFETLLAELRKGVHRRRGLPAPVVVTGPRVIRLALAPWPTFRDWRRQVLDLTATLTPLPLAADPATPATPATPPATASHPAATPPDGGIDGGDGFEEAPALDASTPVKVAWTRRALASGRIETASDLAELAGWSQRTAERHLAAARRSSAPLALAEPDTDDEDDREDVTA